MSGIPVTLTNTEFQLLKKLLENKDRVLTREQLLNDIWDYDYFGSDRVVNVHVGNIRKKLGADFIETIRGVGYKIASEN
jgi:two-component system response regulator VanR